MKTESSQGNAHLIQRLRDRIGPNPEFDTAGERLMREAADALEAKAGFVQGGSDPGYRVLIEDGIRFVHEADHLRIVQNLATQRFEIERQLHNLRNGHTESERGASFVRIAASGEDVQTETHIDRADPGAVTRMRDALLAAAKDLTGCIGGCTRPEGCGLARDCAESAVSGLGVAQPVTDDMVNRFLSWPLPASVCADSCATYQGEPHRTGTNLLSAIEARAMLEHVLRQGADSPTGQAFERDDHVRRESAAPAATQCDPDPTPGVQSAPATNTVPAHGGSVPEGWKLVPLEPTPAMRNVGMTAFNETFGSPYTRLDAEWAAMLNAAPAPPVEGALRWVPVAERLPERSGEYLIWDGEDYEAARWNDGDFYRLIGEEPPTHWMPIRLEPPKTEFGGGASNA